MAEHTQTEVLIVGAGMAGLMAATALAGQGRRVTVVERAHYAGGRLATRSVGPGRADSGAQFFTVRTPVFRKWVNCWMDEGLVFQWSLGWSDGSLGSTPPDGHPRYAVHQGMSALAGHLTRGLDVRLNTHIVSVAPQGTRWEAQDQKSRTYTADVLILTAPIPISLALLATESVPLDDTDRAALERLDYAPCLCGLFWLTDGTLLPEPGAVQRPNAAITWVADNKRKGISPEATLITIHAGPDYSQQLWKLPDWEALVALESGLLLYKDRLTGIVERQLERWRYSMPTVLHKDPMLRAKGLPPLIFAGDAFGTPRVEGAALSGLAAAEALVVKAG
jgi:renalase